MAERLGIRGFPARLFAKRMSGPFTVGDRKTPKIIVEAMGYDMAQLLHTFFEKISEKPLVAEKEDVTRHVNRILIVEDESLIATYLAEIVVALGFEVVDPVGRLTETRELARSQPIEAAILDVW